MSTLGLLFGLILLAYLGGSLFGERGMRGIGLPAGSGYVLLGVALGPQLLGVIDRATLAPFAPLAEVAIAWLLFSHGASFGSFRGERTPLRRIIAGALMGLLVGAVITGSAYVSLGLFPGWSPAERWLIAGGIGAACTDTTRDAVRWMIERRAARGPLSDLLSQVADTDTLLPLLCLPFLFTLVPATDTPLAGWGWELQALLPILVGLALGSVAVLLLGRHFEEGQGLAVVLGTSLLGIGLAARLHLVAITLAFCSGLALRALSPSAMRLRDLLVKVERALASPALLLAGGYLIVEPSWIYALTVATAVLARVLAKLAVGWGLALISPPARGAGPWLGLALTPTGAVSIGVGLEFALHLPGLGGQLVLAAATASALSGELLGPLVLRRVLLRAGELRVEGPAR